MRYGAVDCLVECWVRVGLRWGWGRGYAGLGTCGDGRAGGAGRFGGGGGMAGRIEGFGGGGERIGRGVQNGGLERRLQEVVDDCEVGGLAGHGAVHRMWLCGCVVVVVIAGDGRGARDVD